LLFSISPSLSESAYCKPDSESEIPAAGSLSLVVFTVVSTPRSQK